MPTNFIRRRLDDRPAPAPIKSQSAPQRTALLTAGQAKIRLSLLQTRTADLIWSALPLHSIAETWGDSIHFDTPLKTGRERTAKLNVAIGEVCFWSEDERVVLAWGPTPISRVGEIRMMRPCNIWAQTLDDPTELDGITPGEKVTLIRHN